MEKISAVEYQSPKGGTVTLERDVDWKVTDAHGEHHFASMPQFFAYCRETHGAWPLPSSRIVD
jgi:hypothetical protein